MLLRIMEGFNMTCMKRLLKENAIKSNIKEFQRAEKQTNDFPKPHTVRTDQDSV